jgi:cysteine-rich repeat protein
VNKAWLAIAWLLSIVALPACATSGNEPTGTGGSASTGSTSSSGSAGGQDSTDGGPNGSGGSGGSGGSATPCGDGKLASSESCDDGNTKDGDGCTATCEFEKGWSCVGAPAKCTAVCGDGLLLGEETCDDGDTKKGDGCNPKCAPEDGWSCDTASPTTCTTVCGDGFITGKEQCDDGNKAVEDGCDDGCIVEPGYACISAPSHCETQCGDGFITKGEECDDDNLASDDGCSKECVREDKWTCTGAPSVCITPCGDGLRVGKEQCDDSNTVAGDGCTPTCAYELGWTCEGEPSACFTTCGDGAIAGNEKCDDGNAKGNDGCSIACKVEPGWSCSDKSPSTCVTGCGDGFPIGAEACDDGNSDSGDGCDSICQIEVGFICVSIPSQCIASCGDGIAVGSEQCDDANSVGDDGCDANCNIELGWKCSAPPGSPAVCNTICGDGLVVGVESCDDTNAFIGDCCSPVCQAEPACELELNNEAGLATDFGTFSDDGVIKGNIQPAGDSDFFAISVAPDTTIAITAETIEGSISTCALNTIDSTITIYGPDGVTELGTDDNGGANNCSLLTVGGLNGGPLGADYFVEVKSSVPGKVFDYTLKLTIQITACGNGIKETGEQCDDTNTASGDGCDSSCLFELNAEIEPNNSAGDADVNGPYPLKFLWAGTIDVSSDLDFYWLNLTTTTDLTIETFDGTGPANCATGINPKIEFRAANGTSILASDSDTGVGSCSLLTAAANVGVRHLAPGSYYVVVAPQFTSTVVPMAYMVTATPTALCGNGIIEGFEQCDSTPNCDPNCDVIPVCGDGVLSANEQCDDGNTSNGDGCTSTCFFELYFEIEPNNTAANADVNGPFPLKLLWPGTITVSTDVDFYRLDLTTTTDLSIETFDGTGPANCGTGINPKIEFRAANGTSILASDSDDGAGLCPLLTAATDIGVRHLAPGTYYVVVTPQFTSTVVPMAYMVTAKPTALCGNGIIEGFEQCDSTPNCDPSCDLLPVCGDGVRTSTEQCDDGNTTSGDGCDSSCLFELFAEIEPNNTFAQADALPLLHGNVMISASIGVVGDKDIFKFDVPALSVIRFETFENLTLDCPAILTTLRIFDSAGVQLKLDSAASGISNCAALVVRLAPGSYYVQAEKTSNNAVIPSYFLQIHFGTNLGTETEPNETQAQANTVSGNDFFVFGDHQLAPDSDYYAITIPPGKSIRAETVEGDVVETCESNGVDSTVTLFNAAAVSLVVDGDGGRGFCSLIDGTGNAPKNVPAHGLAAGTYYLQVKGFSTTGVNSQFNYNLHVTVR